MNADKTKRLDLSAFICVHRRPVMFAEQPFITASERSVSTFGPRPSSNITGMPPQFLVQGVRSVLQVERLACSEFCPSSEVPRFFQQFIGIGQWITPMDHAQASAPAAACSDPLGSCGAMQLPLGGANKPPGGRLPIGRKMPSCPTMRCAQAHSSQLSAFSF